MLPFLGAYFHVKNLRYPCIPSRDIHDQRTLQSDWTRVFWPKICAAEFFQIWGSHSKDRIFRYFISGYFQQKKDKILRKLKKDLYFPHFGHFFPILGQITIFLENPILPIFSASKFLLSTYLKGLHKTF